MQNYFYLRPSGVHDSMAGRSLTLETSGGATPAGEAANPRFFSGFLTAPAAAATALLAVADVAAARYYRPSGGASLDPVVTADGDRLRLESFSGCCGVYARLDVLAPGLDGGDVGHGTTNVDVNPPLRRALAGLGGLDPLHLAVGPEELAVRTFDGEFVEKKVPLPERWLRGFAEAQVLAAGFALRAEVPAAEAAALLRAVPRPTRQSGARTTRWVVPAGRTLRPVTRPAPGAVCLPGPERLLTLQTVLRHATTVRVYAPTAADGADAADGAAAVAWEVELPGMRLTLLLSQSASRGFSGEGGVLHDLGPVSEVAPAGRRLARTLAAPGESPSTSSTRTSGRHSPKLFEQGVPQSTHRTPLLDGRTLPAGALVTGSAAADAERIAELIAWEPRIDVADLSGQTGLPADRVRAALTMLGTSGQIGYDIAEEAYFHRHLPYDAGAAETRNPRLRGARALVADGSVRLDGPLARVGKGDDAHVVRTDDATGRLSCTCFWWAKYRGGRGPCKHVLAVGLARGTAAESQTTANTTRSETAR
ncbi:SWIM zinc finger family protein [Streptomyces cavernae]|uniref:SWIM zinc finger family protein n=1 Tax=Streptomyces cavernae TaxID=2259034 RepID=UPI001EE40A43|nr:SWIM zinc finger family protein [Streptomyces cavernae]